MAVMVFALHIAGGTTALLAGVVAVGARKGARVHRRAGLLFVAAMLIMAATGDMLAVIVPGQTVNLLIGTFTLYLICTAWLAARSARHAVLEAASFGVVLVLAIPFTVLSVQLAIGATPLFRSATPFEGPVLIAMYVFTGLLILASVADARLLLAGGRSGRGRIERHLWRMCLGLTFAAGSAFTNGLPRLLPSTAHIPLPLLFVPQFAALGVLIFWMVRVHFTSWYGRTLAVAVEGRSGVLTSRPSRRPFITDVCLGFGPGFRPAMHDRGPQVRVPCDRGAEIYVFATLCAQLGAADRKGACCRAFSRA